MSLISLNRIVEDRAKQDAEYRRELASNGKSLLSDARKLTDVDLLGKLERVGIRLDKSSYAEIAEHALSAEEIFRTFATAEVRAQFKGPFDEDWIWYALTILWERWFPQWPNFEQLDDQIQAGYAVLESDPSAACEQWFKAWADFLLLYDKGSFRKIDEFDEAFGGTQYVSNWTSDFEMALQNAAVTNPHWHERRAQLCEEYLRRFPREDNLTRENMRRALGQATFGKGDSARGDALFEHWLTEDPQWGWGWIGWSDCYFFPGTAANRDLQRAEALLKRGLTVPGVRDREDLLERFSEICQEQGRVEEARRFQNESETARRKNARLHESSPLGAKPSGESGPISGRSMPARSEKIGRNEPCPCGSGKKYKKCCLHKDEESARQATAAARLPDPPQAQAGALSSGEDWSSGLPAGKHLASPQSSERATRPPTEAELELDRLWEEFDTVAKPAVSQMDDFLSKLLSLTPETTAWDEVLHRFAHLEHPDLPVVFRRIAAEVPHTKVSSMGLFYWAAAEEFARKGAADLLPEVAMGFRTLDLDSYDPDALTHVEDCLLAAGYEVETLQLAEHFLPIERADDLMPYAVPRRCSLIFELRVGQALRDGPSAIASPDTLAKQLRSDIEEEIHKDSASLAAEIAAGTASDAAWERSQFDLVTGDISKNDMSWQDCLRLFGTLIRVARETWLLEGRPPGCALRGLKFMLNSVYDWQEQRDKKSKTPSNNLLDFLRPAGMESRIVQSCRAMFGMNVPRAHVLLQAHELLAHFAMRHRLITPDACAQTENELSRLRRELEK